VIDQGEITTWDRRRLAVEISGSPDGEPVFLFHGTPGSKAGPRPRGGVLYRLGIQLISYDRPGYGGSDRHLGRRVADAAADVATIADHLGVKKFAVAGRSGGGPHALACAALLPERVTRAAVLVGLAPSDADNLHWNGGMATANVEEYAAAKDDYETLIESLSSRADDVRVDPDSMVRFLHPQMAESDQQMVSDVTMRRLFTETYREALRNGPEGWVDDALAFRQPWGFDLGSVVAPVLLWHGAQDTFSPVSHSYWLKSKLRHARLEVQPNAAHFEALKVLPDILSWLTDPEFADTETPPCQSAPHVAANGEPVAAMRARAFLGE
jgi:pimeloyl-ACP methyl ester carboxylesterase